MHCVKDNINKHSKEKSKQMILLQIDKILRKSSPHIINFKNKITNKFTKYRVIKLNLITNYNLCNSIKMLLRLF